MLPLSSAMDDGQFNHGGGVGSCGGSVAAAAAAAAAAVAAVEDRDRWQWCLMAACHRPWPYGGKHSSLKAAIC